MKTKATTRGKDKDRNIPGIFLQVVIAVALTATSGALLYALINLPRPFVFGY